jgi:hypothetical protein
VVGGAVGMVVLVVQVPVYGEEFLPLAPVEERA